MSTAAPSSSRFGAFVRPAAAKWSRSGAGVAAAATSWGRPSAAASFSLASSAVRMVSTAAPLRSGAATSGARTRTVVVVADDMIVIAGPSGSGKSTLIGKLMKEFPGSYAFSVSHTTRKPRPGEQHGVNYYYVERDEMQREIDADGFVETTEFSGNVYGTSKRAILDVVASGRTPLFDLDIRGVKSLRACTDMHFRYLFVMPPSIDELERRLTQRGEARPSIERRLSVAREEMDYAAQPGTFDLVIVNDDLDRAYALFRDFVRNGRKAGQTKFVTVTEITDDEPSAAPAAGASEAKP